MNKAKLSTVAAMLISAQAANAKSFGFNSAEKCSLSESLSKEKTSNCLNSLELKQALLKDYSFHVAVSN